MTNYPPPPGNNPYGQPPQYPPQGYGTPPAGYGMPPQGYGMPPGGPMGGYPGVPLQPQQGNGWALASLITALVGFCVPLLGGFLAVLFAFFGFRTAKKSNSGKGLAVAGLILGLLSLAGWGVFGIAGFGVWKATETNRQLAVTFVNDLSAGDISKAGKSTDDSTVTEEELRGMSGYVKKHGSITDVTSFSFEVKETPGASTAEVVSIVTFSDGSKHALLTRQHKVNGVWKIFEARINPQ
jgi:hypothetical protein